MIGVFDHSTEGCAGNRYAINCYTSDASMFRLLFVQVENSNSAICSRFLKKIGFS